MPGLSILVVDPAPLACTSSDCGQLLPLLRTGLRAKASFVRQSSTWEATPRNPAPDLIIARIPPPETSAACPGAPPWIGVPILAVLCPRWNEPQLIMTLLRKGVDDYCSCPVSRSELLPRLERLVARSVRTEGNPRPECSLEMIGNSPAFLTAVSRIVPFAASEAPVLISGETGTGKELFARAIHYGSARRGSPFVPVNCAAIPDHLFENELFGHVRGAYTDAGSTETGLLGLADKGSLFLDEVDSLSPAAQAKLLRFLQDKEYRPLGTAETRIADVRIIAASNAPLRRRADEGAFRPDLFHRLNVLSIHVPPLRERPEDIPGLAAHFLALYERQYGRDPLSFSPDAVGKLLAYDWPGNVREMDAVIHRAVALASSALLHTETLDIPAAYAVESEGPPHSPKREMFARLERAYLMQLLAENSGNVTRAARASGLDRRTLQRHMAKHGVARNM